MFQVINENNTKLYDATLKQQETMTNYLKSKSEQRKVHTVLMQKQLDAIIALVPKKPRVPPSHFQSSSIDGISFASSTVHQENVPVAPALSMAQPDQPPVSTPLDTTTWMNAHLQVLSVPHTSNQDTVHFCILTSTTTQVLSIPPSINRPCTDYHTAANDASIASFQSATQGYQDIRITVATFKESWLQNDALKARMWYSNIISELASKSYYHPLLTADKKHINFAAPVKGPNATLHSALQTKLLSHFRTMILNSCYLSGTAILKVINSSLTLF